MALHGAQRIRSLLGEGRPLVLGGVYDGLTVRLANQAGFEVLFVGGFSVAATHLGEPDLGYITQTEMADAARRICRLTECPVLVDADTGYGNPLNVRRTVELYQNAGAAGLFLEDQVWPKRCGHMAGKEVVPREEWLAKLRAVLSLRPAIDLFVVARTDARGPKGLEEAIRRGRAAVDLGVDAVFVEAPQSVAELDAIALGIQGPKVANMVEGGKTPIMSPTELHQRGFDLIVYPVAAILAQAKAVGEVFATLRREGTTASMMERLLPFEEFNTLVGLERHRAREGEPVQPQRRQRPGSAAAASPRARPKASARARR